MQPPSFADRVHGIATLDHPLTLSVYRLLGEREQLSRDATAEALELPRSVAAFHLDKLAAAGLAEVHFERLTGRTGPGAGRTAKVYRRAATALEASAPERRYDLAGAVLADAVERSVRDGQPVEAAVRAAATETGRRIGEDARPLGGRRPAAATRRDAVLDLLARHGYEPRRSGRDVVLANCPFHTLARAHRDLVCGMNLDLVAGIIDGSGSGDILMARLAPEPGSCCVRLRAG